MLSVDVRAARGDFALEVRFQAGPGFTVLYGPSGAGKSTVLDCIGGTLRPTCGRIALGDRVLFDAAQDIDLASHRRRTPRVFQEGRLLPHLSVRDNLAYGQRGSDLSVREVAAFLEIGELLDRSPRELSGGQRQRVALGRALLASPAALLLDEPLAALELALRRRILPFLQRLQERFAIPMVYVTHSPEEALRLADQVLRIEAGRVVERGSAQDVLGGAVSRAVPELAEGDILLAARIEAHEVDGGITVCRCGDVRLRMLRCEAPAGSDISLVLSPRDLILSRTHPQGLSARNCLPARVVGVVDREGLLRVDLLLEDDRTRLHTVVTKAAAEEMRLAAGPEVFVIFKSSSLRRVP